MIAVGWGAMGSTDLTQLLSVLVIAQWCEARGQTRKDRGSNPRKVELSTHEWNTESGQHSVDQPPSTQTKVPVPEEIGPEKNTGTVTGKNLGTVTLCH